MTASREAILTAIRGSRDRKADCEPAARRQGVVPARAKVDGRRRIERFVEEATRVGTTVARVDGPSGVPGAVVAYLAEHNLPSVLKMAPDPALRGIPWSRREMLTVIEGRAVDGDLVGVTGALAGVAETGTLVLLSGPESPTTLNFLPDTHIAILDAAAIVGAYEDAWALVRARAAAGMPRLVNWITGPSRTADIEQALLIGVHGPRRHHIVLIDGEGR